MSSPKILTLDIETSPAVAYIWRTFKENISNDQILEPTRMITFAAKWLGKKNVIVKAEWGEGGHEGMVKALWELLDEADIIVTYNGKSFDIPHSNREFALIGLTPPSPYGHVDLYNTVKSKFKFMSGKLGWVVQVLDLGGKMAHEGFGLWKSVLDGDTGAQKRMERYNAQDVRITEELYIELLPWISAHPNMALLTGEVMACPTCASKDLQKRGIQRTLAFTFQRYCCNTCGAYCRSRKSIETTELVSAR